MAARVAATWLLLVVAACGGGGGGGGGNQATPLQFLSTTLNDGVLGILYVQTVAVIGGSGAKSYAITAGALPAGLALNSANGALSGTPNGTAGTSNFTITVTDSGSPQQSEARALTIRIAEPLTVNLGTYPVATIGVPYVHAVTASGGIPPYSYFASPPPGLAIDGNGVISGTPLPDAVTAFSGVTVRDSATPQQLGHASDQLRVTLEVVTTALPDATGGIEYHEALRARGGMPPNDWEITGGALPPGLQHRFFPGHILGVPVASCSPTTFFIDAEVTDRDSPPRSATRQGVTLLVTKAPLMLPASSLPVGRIGVPYSDFIRATFGVSPYAYSLAAGSLPSQLSIGSATGQITGTPDTQETRTFTVLATDTCGTTASNDFNLLVDRAPQGRNDSIATATAITNGAFLASISPSGHPNTVFSPDQDYYSITTFAASTVTIDLNGLRGEIDTVIEILDVNGTRLNSCGPPAFASECMNDDEGPGVSLDSFLQVQVPGPTTFYVHVVEWRFDGRPDLLYTITVSDVN